MASGARGQSLPAGSFVGETEADRLAREVEDPTAILTQLKLQDLYAQQFSNDGADQHGSDPASDTGRIVFIQMAGCRVRLQKFCQAP